MPEQETIKRARKDAREGKSPSTQAGEFVREEFHHIRQGKHGARSSRQAIAIGLSKARRAGVRLRPPKRGSAKVKRRAQREYSRGSRAQHKISRRRSRATLGALKREGRGAASARAISRTMRTISRRRGTASRLTSARKAAQTRTRHPSRRGGRQTTMKVHRAGRSLLSSATRRMARNWLARR